MNTQRLIFSTLVIVISAILVVAVFFYLQYRRDIQADYQRVESLGTRVIETGCGPIQYTSYGEGYPVLVVHGIFGGFDQGLVLARGQLGEDYQSIIPSRFGYLGTPLPEDASPEEQADAFACLLDALSLERSAIIGTSAGGTSAIQFALRHPDRCSGLILISSNAPGEVEVGLPPKPLAEVLFRSDFIFWIMTNYFPSSMYSIMGVPNDFEMTQPQVMEMRQVMDTILPVRPRSDGALFDMYVSNPDINTGYQFENIQVPVLMIHAEDDPLASYQNANRMAARIPETDLVTIESGGHPLLGQDEKVQFEIRNFLQRIQTE